MNNKPVAWRNLCVSNIGEDSEWIYNEIGEGTPLYTHQYERPHNTVLVPCAKLAEMQAELALLKTHPADLTDEEIALVWDKFSALQSPKDIKDFAKAILRKAQEK